MPDWLDDDDDDDGIDTLLEVAESIADADADNDGTPNWLDPDADNDGLIDGIDGTADVDDDGLPNWLDLDSDGDGFLDSVEGLNDDDADGIADYIDFAALPDVIDLSIASTTPSRMKVGVADSFVLHVRNVGARSTVSSILVIDVLPTGVKLESFSGDGWSCTTEAQKVVCAHPGPCRGGRALPNVALEVSVDEAAVPEVLLRVIMLEAPAMVTAALSLKVMLPRFMSERPVVTLACWVAPVAPKMTLTALPPGTTPPAAVPAASVAQLLVVPLERVIAPRAPVSCPPSQ